MKDRLMMGALGLVCLIILLMTIAKQVKTVDERRAEIALTRAKENMAQDARPYGSDFGDGLFGFFDSQTIYNSVKQEPDGKTFEVTLWMKSHNSEGSTLMTTAKFKVIDTGTSGFHILEEKRLSHELISY